MEGRTIAIIIAVLVVLGGGWYLLKGGTVPSTTNEAGEYATSSDQSAAAPMIPASGAVVTYTDQGFSPASLSVAEGTTVSFINQSSGQMWVASGVHPAHTLYDGTDRATHCAAGYTGPTPFDECQAVGSGSTYTFTFTKAGTWKYHNHMNPSAFGSVTVQ